jgi:hypothetical protein
VLRSGSLSSIKASHLIDGGKNWSGAGIVTGMDEVKNTISGLYAIIGAVGGIPFDYDLTLSNNLFPGGNETYKIYKCTDSYFLNGGTDTQIAGRLIDTANAHSTWTSTVVPGDIVRNITQGTETTVSSVFSNTVLILNSAIFAAGAINDEYAILSQTLIDSGTATPLKTSHLIDCTVDFTSGATVSIGDLVRQNGGSSYAHVNGISANDLTLDTDIFTSEFDTYQIYHNYCTTHAANPVDTFYNITIDYAMGVSSGGTVNVYNYKAITGTAKAEPANPLEDNAFDFTTPPVIAGDVAVNCSAPPGASTVTTALHPIRAHSLDLTSSLFSNAAQKYSLLRFLISNTDASHVVTAGTTDGVNVAGHLMDSTNAFAAVVPGDVVYNVTDAVYAMVTVRTANNLTLTWNAVPTGKVYIIIHQRGVLYVWQDAVPDILGEIRSIDTPGTLVLKSSFAIVNNAQNPRTVSDGYGRAIIVYDDIATSKVRAVSINGAGNQYWAPKDVVTGASGETVKKVISDNSGGVIVFLARGTNLYVQRLSSTGAALWPAAGLSIANPAAASQEDIVYDSVNDDILVTANIGNRIWGVRVSSDANYSWAGKYLSGPAGVCIQQNPKACLSGTNAVIVWDDNRFVSNTGYGIFGIKINSQTGVPDVTWNANASGTNDQNGASVILNRYNQSWSNPLIVPYNNGANARLLWEDYRAGNGTDLVVHGSDLFTYTP